MSIDPFLLRDSLTRFLAEDLGRGDVTTEAIFAPEAMTAGRFLAKGHFVACGVATVAPLVFTLLDPEVQVRPGVADGQLVAPGQTLCTLAGRARSLLRGERVALNLAMRLSGIATLTAAFVERLAGLPVRVLDTRKTVPGLRLLDKYAVRTGGGHNHRFGLDDGILVKDNHVAACGSIAEAVARVRARAPHTLRLQVEASTLDEVAECLAAGVDAILLDNMDGPTLRQAVALVAGRAFLEASGGITLETVRAVAETGVQAVSVGALTHSAPAADISMRLGPGSGKEQRISNRRRDRQG
ncbi:MAG: carboxylating nicotinate-nucleotide diphosphorylase [Thermodesulfobacteriota bacterium]